MVLMEKHTLVGALSAWALWLSFSVFWGCWVTGSACKLSRWVSLMGSGSGWGSGSGSQVFAALVFGGGDCEVCCGSASSFSSRSEVSQRWMTLTYMIIKKYLKLRIISLPGWTGGSSITSMFSSSSAKFCTSLRDEMRQNSHISYMWHLAYI